MFTLLLWCICHPSKTLVALWWSGCDSHKVSQKKNLTVNLLVWKLLSCECLQKMAAMQSQLWTCTKQSKKRTEKFLLAFDLTGHNYGPSSQCLQKNIVLDSLMAVISKRVNCIHCVCPNEKDLWIIQSKEHCFCKKMELLCIIQHSEHHEWHSIVLALYWVGEVMIKTDILNHLSIWPQVQVMLVYTSGSWCHSDQSSTSVLPHFLFKRGWGGGELEAKGGQKFNYVGQLLFVAFVQLFVIMLNLANQLPPPSP